MSAKLPPRITELPNELTTNIDTSGETGIVRLLRQSDAQLFAGWSSHPALVDSEILGRISKLVTQATTLLKENTQNGRKNAFIFTGCGTSGRIAWSCSRSFNRILHQLGMKPCFHYLIAGGDRALIVGNELVEDDPPRGTKELKDIAVGLDHVMLFGITCGLSAPYVAGQIDHAMKNPSDYTTVLMGFNPVKLARDVAIEKWDKTCKQTFLELEKLERESDRAVILNPIVGPEPITGSSRMKGGSMTAILLNVIFTVAFSQAFQLPLEKLLMQPSGPVTASITASNQCRPPPARSNEGRATLETAGEQSTIYNGTTGAAATHTSYVLSPGVHKVASLIDAFAATYHAAYRPSEGIASLISMAGHSLRHTDGHLYYLGAEAFGIIGFIDSSEMVSTFGSSPEEIRGFIERGWEACQNREGDQSETSQLFCISVDDFEQNILPNLSCNDTVIRIGTDVEGVVSKEDHTHLETVMEKVFNTQAKRALLMLSSDKHDQTIPQLNGNRYDITVLIQLPYFSVLQTEPLFAGFALKLILNAISTGANILKGRVYNNTMINLTVANDKLFYRSISIISKLSEVSSEEAQEALLKAIYKQDNTDQYKALPVSSHIKAAVQQNMVVPLALVLARRQCTLSEAMDTISSTKSIRTLIEH